MAPLRLLPGKSSPSFSRLAAPPLPKDGRTSWEGGALLLAQCLQAHLDADGAAPHHDEAARALRWYKAAHV